VCCWRRQDGREKRIRVFNVSEDKIGIFKVKGCRKNIGVKKEYLLVFKDSAAKGYDLLELDFSSCIWFSWTSAQFVLLTISGFFIPRFKYF